MTVAIERTESSSNEEYEAVHTMTDYWDGPRGGIANFKGVPHIYESLFDEETGKGNDTFLLSPIDEEVFQLALEDWEIWLRWKHADDRGEAPPNSHPALPQDRARHEEIELLLKERMEINPGRAINAKAEWKRLRPDVPFMEAALVKWTEVNE